MADLELMGLALLLLAAFAAGFIDAVVGGGGLITTPALLLLLPGAPVAAVLLPAAFFLSELGTPPEALEGMKASPEWEAIKKIDFTLAYDFEVLGDGTVPTDIAKAIAVPTLVMDGEKSMDFMHATAEQIAKLVPGAQRKTLAGQTHQASAEAVAPALIDFLRG